MATARLRCTTWDLWATAWVGRVWVVRPTRRGASIALQSAPLTSTATLCCCPSTCWRAGRRLLPQQFDCAQVIALYCDHATNEQFHSEFKTDMDLQRLPSGKFNTNYLVCQLAAVAMNLLRLIGQNTLNEPDAPVRHAAKRRRIKTVMQQLMFKAARMISMRGRWVLGLGHSETAFAVFERHYAQLGSAAHQRQNTLQTKTNRGCRYERQSQPWAKRVQPLEISHKAHANGR